MSTKKFKDLLKDTSEALPPDGKAEMNAIMKFSLLPKVIEDFLTLYPTSVLATQLPIIRESAQHAYRTIFEEKANLIDLTDEQKGLLANILVMIELLQDGDYINYDPTKCRVCKNEAKYTCSKCKSIKYCSTFCQKAGYGMHKKQCNTPIVSK
jgi:hypothetical protein